MILSVNENFVMEQEICSLSGFLKHYLTGFLTEKSIAIVYCFWYTFAMRNYDMIYENAADNYGLRTDEAISWTNDLIRAIDEAVDKML